MAGLFFDRHPELACPEPAVGFQDQRIPGFTSEPENHIWLVVIPTAVEGSTISSAVRTKVIHYLLYSHGLTNHDQVSMLV